jgi:SAM-dependent methyltransferase
MPSVLHALNAADSLRMQLSGEHADDHPTCALCGSVTIDPHAQVFGRDYLRCATCALVFLHPAQRLSRAAEAEYYRLHRNDADDAGYRRFVAPLVGALCARLPSGSEGLDFGCGEASAVSAMLREAGHVVRGFDPLFAPDAQALQRAYDFIVLSEVAEHLHAPAEVFARLRTLLRAGGLIAVGTGFPPEAARFAQWHYLRDPTHVAFWSPATCEWLARRLGLRCEVAAANVVLLAE